MKKTLTYACPNASTDGMFTPLVCSLALTLAPSSIDLAPVPTARKRLTLWFRRGAKRIFYVSVIRKTGSYVIRMGGIDPSEALNAIHICRDHFDNWFQISPEDVSSTN